jgi:hypothetical protein
MAFLSHTTTRRAVAARSRVFTLHDAACRLTFLLAIGFAAALVFGLIGH